MATGLQMSMPSTAYHDQTKLLDIKTTTLEQGRIPVVGHLITVQAIGSLQVQILIKCIFNSTSHVFLIAQHCTTCTTRTRAYRGGHSMDWTQYELLL